MKKFMSIVLAIICMFGICVSASAVTEVPQHTKDFLAKDAVSVSEENGVYTYIYADGEIITAEIAPGRETCEDKNTITPNAFFEDDKLVIVYENGVKIKISNITTSLDNYGRPCMFFDEYDNSFVMTETNNLLIFGPVLWPGDEGYVPIVLDDSDNPGENNDSGETPDENNEKQSWFVSFIKAVINIFQRIVEFFRGLFQK